MTFHSIAVLSLLWISVAVRPQGGADSINTRTEARRALGEALCAEDESPTKEENQYCHYFNANEDVCQADAKCRWVDLSAKQTGKKMCKPKCKSSGSEEGPEKTDGLSVPPEVADAVKEARGVAEAAEREATAKLEAANLASSEATRKKDEAEAAAKAANDALQAAEDKEQAALASKDAMEQAAEAASKADTAAASSTQAWKEALAAKQEKRAVMESTLKKKQQKEGEWKMEDESLRTEILQLSPKIATMEAEMASLQEKMRLLEGQMSEAKSKRQDLQKKRTANKATRKTEGGKLKKEYVSTVDEYRAAKATEERLQKDASAATAANRNATAASQQAAQEYWKKVNAYNAATDETMKRKNEADIAQEAALQAQLLLAEQTQAQAVAQRARDIAQALYDKVQSILDYATIFYQNLAKVQEPGGNPMMNVMLLVQDPAMKPTLASYNVVITAANDIGKIGNAEILSKLQVGLTKIDSDRSNHFAHWCGDESFARWIWGANEIEKEELHLS